MRSALFRAMLAVSLAACALSLPGGPLGPKAAWSASPALDAAQKLYDNAKFNDAIAGLRDALATGGVTGVDALKAKELMGRCLVKAGRRVEARELFKNLLRQDRGYRPDAAIVPPDEVEVFELALREIVADEITAGQRIPASLSFHTGVGSGDNKSLGTVQSYYGGGTALDVRPVIGGSVRFPLRPRWSLDLELGRLRATGKAPGRDSVLNYSSLYDFKLDAYATPLVVSVYWTALPGDKYRAHVFAGAGALLSATNQIDMGYSIGFDPPVRLLVVGTKTGTYFHVGGEGEYMLHPRVSLTGRALYRYATLKQPYRQSGIMKVLAAGAPPLETIKLDFSGYEAAIGLRAYIGY